MKDEILTPKLGVIYGDADDGSEEKFPKMDEKGKLYLPPNWRRVGWLERNLHHIVGDVSAYVVGGLTVSVSGWFCVGLIIVPWLRYGTKRATKRYYNKKDQRKLENLR